MVWACEYLDHRQYTSTIDNRQAGGDLGWWRMSRWELGRWKSGPWRKRIRLPVKSLTTAARPLAPSERLAADDGEHERVIRLRHTAVPLPDGLQHVSGLGLPGRTEAPAEGGEEFGMFHPLALKLGSPGDRRIVEPAWHTYLALFADDPRYPLTPEECNRLGPLHPDLQRALARIRLPLAMEEPLRLQIVREQRLGMVLLARDGRVLGTNGRAWVLAERFARGSQRPKRGAVRDLTDACLRGGESGEWVRAFHESSGSSGTIVVSRHEILGPPREDVILLLFREIAVPASPEGAPQGPWSALSGRARQIAELLVSSGKPYKQLADDVGIAVGTFRKHVELLYRTLGVSSRAELTALPRRGRLDPGTHG